MAEITELLDQARSGDDAALKAVFERLYTDLKNIAVARIGAVRPMGRGGHRAATLTPTALVHEAYERLIGASQLELADRRHFFACAARAMKHIIVDHARRIASEKRGGDQIAMTWTEDLVGRPDAGLELVDLGNALDDLSEISVRARDVVEMRFLAGLTAQETAEVLEISLRTANREWEMARAFLKARLARV